MISAIDMSMKNNTFTHLAIQKDRVHLDLFILHTSL